VERFSGTDGKAMKPDELKEVATCLSPSAATSFVEAEDLKRLCKEADYGGFMGFILVLSYSLSRQSWMTIVHTTRQVSTCWVGVSMA